MLLSPLRGVCPHHGCLHWPLRFTSLRNNYNSWKKSSWCAIKYFLVTGENLSQAFHAFQMRRNFVFWCPFLFLFFLESPKQYHTQVSYIFLKMNFPLSYTPWNKSPGDFALDLLEFFNETQKRCLPDPKYYPNENSVFNSLNSFFFLVLPSGKERQVQMLAWPQLANTKIIEF